jgi:hypothetical protein
VSTMGIFLPFFRPFVRPAAEPSFHPDPRALAAWAWSRMAVAHAVTRRAAPPGHSLTREHGGRRQRVRVGRLVAFACSKQRQDDRRRARPREREDRVARPYMGISMSEQNAQQTPSFVRVLPAMMQNQLVTSASGAITARARPAETFAGDRGPNERLQPGTSRRRSCLSLMRHLSALMTDAVHGEGGTVESFTGDGGMRCSGFQSH